MRIKYISLFLAANIYLACIAQYQENLPQAKPIPPNAAALFKVLERPVGTYTGTIPISFPLCGVSSGPLTTSLSLDYNSTGGIKVEELGGPVGLGFNLSDGAGRITQMVRGKRPDDWGGILNTGSSSIKPSNFTCDMDDAEILDLSNVDLEYDVFMYSFNGHSGKFYIKENGQIILTKNDPIKIDYGSIPSQWSGFSSWTITDENGTKYVFGSRIINQSSYSSSGGTGSTNVSSISYYLNYIEDMNGENRISFTYTGTGNVFSTYSGGFLQVGSLSCCCAAFNTSYDQGSVTTDGSEYLVSRIDAKSGYILVNSTAAYLNGPKRVNSIQLYDPSNNLKKQYKFNYGSPFESLRQKLINFSEFAASGADSLTTKFEYIETENLPSVFSPSVDIWGFYNHAANNNTGLIPNIIYPVPGVNVTLDWTFWANRNANWFYGRANILRKITYPTGGYREIDYEGNEAFADGDFFRYHPNSSFLAPYMVDRDFNETGFHNYGTSTPCLQHLFTINSTTGHAKFYYTLNNPGWSCGAYTIKIKRLIDSTDLNGGVEVASFTQQTTANKLLVNGYYRVDVFIGANQYSSSCTMNGIEGEWQDCTLIDSNVSTPYGTFYKKARPMGGVRVKEVRDYDPAANKIYKRQYKYKLYSTDSTLTSGLLVSPVNILQTQNISTTNCEYLALCPGSSYPLASEGGSFVVYPEVRTIDSANGWIDNNFSYAPDYPSTSFPYTPTEDMSFRRGHLVQEKVYDKNGTLLQRKRMGYTERYGSLSQIGYKYKPYWYVGAYNATYTEFKPSNPYHPVGIMACNQYGSMGIFWTLSSKVETTCTAAGNITDSTLYTYANYNNYYYLKSESNFSSNGSTKLRSYKYPFNNNSDFRFGLSAYEQTMKSTLLGKNFFQPLEVIDSIKSIGGSYSFLHGSKYIFGKYNNDSLIHLNTFRSFTAATDSSEIRFSAYDSSGNLREQYRSNDVKDVYVWGYNRTYPVAKVAGSNLSTVLGFVDINVINNPSSDAALRTELNKIRNGLAGTMAQVITYTYSPLYGMTSMTDAAGRTIYYEYDLFGRLKLVRDQDNRIVKKIEYKLNNPQ